MQLKKFSYKEHLKQADPWSVSGIELDSVNLIVGKNTTGKTRTVSTIFNLASYISGRRPNGFTDSEWSLEFTDDTDSYIYTLAFNDKGFISKETLGYNGKTVLTRNDEGASIWPIDADVERHISPPADKLVLAVRRDKLEYPFFEKIIEWSESVLVIKFDRMVTDNLVGQPVQSDFNTIAPLDLTDMGIAPHLWDKLDDQEKSRVVSDVKAAGFDVVDVLAEENKDIVSGFQGVSFKTFSYTEKGLEKPIPQQSLSTGLLRSVSLIVIVNYLTSRYVENTRYTLLVDDFGEGLDYDRANLLSKVIFNKLKQSTIQLIVASNSRAMMNGVDIEYWNILTRKAGKVKSLNYHNAKEQFDNFKDTGLSNFDLFTSDFLKGK